MLFLRCVYIKNKKLVSTFQVLAAAERFSGRPRKVPERARLAQDQVHHARGAAVAASRHQCHPRSVPHLVGRCIRDYQQSSSGTPAEHPSKRSTICNDFFLNFFFFWKRQGRLDRDQRSSGPDGPLCADDVTAHEIPVQKVCAPNFLLFTKASFFSFFGGALPATVLFRWAVFPRSR